MTAPEALRQYWGYSHFRPYQEAIIESVLKGNDTLALLPTGGGKSITFQIPALILKGLTLVVSPLIALMKDQTVRLKKLGISSEFLSSGMSGRELDRILENCRLGKVNLLYISPERLGNNFFLERIRNIEISLIAVDEAHCISGWGYDFRPSYLQIADIRKIHPLCPVLALTATATLKVREDIQVKLNFHQPKVFTGSFKRENIFYKVHSVENKNGFLISILKKYPGTALIYIRSRKKAKEIAEFLNRNELKASYYHAGLSYPEREKTQKEWVEEKIKIMVATNAFGMGIDKENVEIVIHYSPPDNLESFYQESGRAGRNGNPSQSIILYEEADKREIWEIFKQNHPDDKLVGFIYDSLGNYLQVPLNEGAGLQLNFNQRNFSEKFKIPFPTVSKALRILMQYGFLNITESKFISSKVKIIINPNEILEFISFNTLANKLLVQLLRKFPGALIDSTELYVEELGNDLEISKETIVELLNYLHNAGFVEYMPSTPDSQIQFLKNRVPIKYLKLPSDEINQLNRIQNSKLELLWGYIENLVQCRSRQLLTYFDEVSTQNCGHCDNCLRSLDDEFDLKGIILDSFPNQPMPIHKVLDLFHEYPEESILENIRKLIDQGFLGFSSSFEVFRQLKNDKD